MPALKPSSVSPTDLLQFSFFCACVLRKHPQVASAQRPRVRFSGSKTEDYKRRGGKFLVTYLLGTSRRGMLDVPCFETSSEALEVNSFFG